MFEFYLASCERAVLHQREMVFQMQLTRSVDALPITRSDMLDPPPRAASHASADRALGAPDPR